MGGTPEPPSTITTASAANRSSGTGAEASRTRDAANSGSCCTTAATAPRLTAGHDKDGVVRSPRRTRRAISTRAQSHSSKARSNAAGPVGTSPCAARRCWDLASAAACFSAALRSKAKSCADSSLRRVPTLAVAFDLDAVRRSRSPPEFPVSAQVSASVHTEHVMPRGANRDDTNTHWCLVELRMMGPLPDRSNPAKNHAPNSWPLLHPRDGHDMRASPGLSGSPSARVMSSRVDDTNSDTTLPGRKCNSSDQDLSVGSGPLAASTSAAGGAVTDASNAAAPAASPCTCGCCADAVGADCAVGTAVEAAAVEAAVAAG